MLQLFLILQRKKLKKTKSLEHMVIEQIALFAQMPRIEAEAIQVSINTQEVMKIQPNMSLTLSLFEETLYCNPTRIRHTLLVPFPPCLMPYTTAGRHSDLLNFL